MELPVKRITEYLLLDVTDDTCQPPTVQIETIQIVILSGTLSTVPYFADKPSVGIKGKQAFGILHNIVVARPLRSEDIAKQYPVGSFQRNIADTVH